MTSKLIKWQSANALCVLILSLGVMPALADSPFAVDNTTGSAKPSSGGTHGIATKNSSATKSAAAKPAAAAASNKPEAGNGNSPFAVDNSADSSNSSSLPKLATAKEYFIRGLKEFNDKDFTNSVADYTDAIRLNPKYGEAYANRAASRFNAGDYQGAVNDSNESLKYFPTNKIILDQKAMFEKAIRDKQNEQAQAGQQAAEQQAAAQARMRAVMMGGGDFSDPSTIIMMNAQRRGLVPQQPVDYSDPASIIMENARKRGLVPANTPNP